MPNIIQVRRTILRSPAAVAAPVVYPSVRNYVAVGDSITDSDRTGTAVGGGYAKAAYMLASPAIATFNNQALSGTGVGELITDAATVDALLQSGQSNILSVFIGANNAPDTTFLTSLASYCDARRAAGWYVLLGTLLPQTVQPSFNAARVTANTEIRKWTASGSTVVGKHADRVFDFAADPVMGLDATASNLTYFIDGLHPTLVGQARMRDIFWPVLDAAMSNAAPAPTVISVNSYTSEAGGPDTIVRLRADRGVSWSLSGGTDIVLNELSNIKLNAIAAGTYTTTITATDGAGRTTAQSFTWNVVAPPAGYGPNLVTNGTAAQGMFGWNTSETLWFTGTATPLSAVDKVGGGKEFKIQGDGGGFPQSARNIPVESGATYKADCTVRLGTTASYQVFRVDPGVEIYSNAIVDTPITGTIVANSASSLMILFIAGNPESGNAYFGQIAVRKVL